MDDHQITNSYFSMLRSVYVHALSRHFLPRHKSSEYCIKSLDDNKIDQSKLNSQI